MPTSFSTQDLALRGAGATLPGELDAACGPLDTATAFDRLSLAPDPRSDRWGVEHRHWSADPGGTRRVFAEDLAAEAARRALASAGLDRVDVLHVATSTPRTISSSLAARVAHRLGHDGLAVDVRGGGVGTLFALIEAAGMLKLGASSALVVGVEVLSPFLRPGDASTVLFGDGAGALVVTRGPGALEMRAGTVKVEGTPFTIPGALPPTELDGFRFQPPDRPYVEGLAAARRAAGVQLVELGPVDVVQAYGATVDQIAELGQIVGAPVITSFGRTGCLGSAAFPVAVEEWRRSSSGPARLGAVAAAGGVLWAAARWTLP